MYQLFLLASWVRPMRKGYLFMLIRVTSTLQQLRDLTVQYNTTVFNTMQLYSIQYNYDTTVCDTALFQKGRRAPPYDLESAKLSSFCMKDLLVVPTHSNCLREVKPEFLTLQAELSDEFSNMPHIRKDIRQTFYALCIYALRTCSQFLSTQWLWYWYCWPFRKSVLL